jgi:hypothetical protein
MKVATFVFLLAVCGAVMGAQTSAVSSRDVTIRMSTGSGNYCLGPYGPLFQGGRDNITLMLPLKLRYENHRSETIILPFSVHHFTRMTVAGQNGSTVLRSVGGGDINVNTVMALSRPDTRESPFSILPGKRAESSTVLDLAQCLSATDRGCFPDFVWIPVLNRSSGLDLRGKAVQIVTTYDHRSLAPEVVEKLNEKWKDYGTVWAGVVESETVTVQIPIEPVTRNCMTPLPR